MWKSYIDVSGMCLVNFVLDWMQFFRGPIHIVHYEDLRYDLWNELEDILKFLGVDYSPRTLKCAIENSIGNFKRNQTTLLKHDPFTIDMKVVIGTYQRAIEIAMQLRKSQQNGCAVNSDERLREWSLDQYLITEKAPQGRHVHFRHKCYHATRRANV